MTKCNAESDADEQGGIACLRNDPMTKPFTMKCFGKLSQLTPARDSFEYVSYHRRLCTSSIFANIYKVITKDYVMEPRMA